MVQGDPLAMFTYGIGILPWITCLRPESPDITQPWYPDYAGALGTFENVELYFNSLKRFIQSRGYFPEPFKRIMIVHPDNTDFVKLFGLHHGFNVCTGACYTGKFIG